MEIKSFASGSSGNSYLVSDGETKLLIEAGIRWSKIQKELNYQVSDIEGAIISHSHKDHCKSVEGVMNAGIDCFMSGDTAKEIGISSHRLKVVEEQKQFDIGTLKILPFRLQHDVKNFGYLLYSKKTKERTIFITDSFYCKYNFSKLNYIMIEANYSDEILDVNIEEGRLHPALKNRIKKSHMSLKNVIEFLKASDTSELREIMLIHLSNGNADAKLFKQEVEKAIGVPTKVFY